MAGGGLLRAADSDALAAYVSAIVDLADLTRSAGETGAADLTPERIRELRIAREHMLRLGARFGATPADRARLAVVAGDDPARSLLDFIASRSGDDGAFDS